MLESITSRLFQRRAHRSSAIPKLAFFVILMVAAIIWLIATVSHTTNSRPQNRQTYNACAQFLSKPYWLSGLWLWSDILSPALPTLLSLHVICRNLALFSLQHCKTGKQHVLVLSPSLRKQTTINAFVTAPEN